MPLWFKRQLQQAFMNKDLKQVHLLNQCWFYYKNGNDSIK